MSHSRLVKLGPPGLDQRLRLHVGAALRVLIGRLNPDYLKSVELLDESQDFLELRLGFGNLQGATQELQGGLALDVLLGWTQGLVRIQQSLRLRKKRVKSG